MAIFTGIAGAISGLMASTFLSGAVGSFLLKTAVGIGLSLLAQSIAGKPQEPTFSINGTLQSGGDLPRSFLIGRTSTAGSLVWVNTWGRDGDTPNAYLTQVIALSDLPVAGLRQVWVNGQKVSLVGNNTSWGYQVPEYRNDGDNLWIKFYDGTQTVADSFLVNTCSNVNRQWDAKRVGRGVAYAIVTARVSKQMFSGIPNFKFELDGFKFYDISKDSSMGGNGTQREADPSTWGGDGDHLPAVQAYNLLRGLRWNNQWFYGVQGMALARLPAENWIKAINKCRAPMQGAGGLEPTYRAGGEITIDAPLANALEALNTSCQGRIAEIGGIYQMFLGVPDAPVIHFTDDDILSTDEQTFTPFFGLADTINGVAATYPSAADGWVVKSAPSLYRSDLEALHGNRRLMAKVELNFVPYAEQVQRLMKSALEEGQRARRHTLVLPPKFWAYSTPARVFSWTSKRNGYVNKLMRLDGVVDRANLDVLVDLTEVDPADYDWSSGTDFKPPVDGAVGAMRPAPMPVYNFTAEPSSVLGDDGIPRRPAILLKWKNVTGIDYVEYELELSSNLTRADNGYFINTALQEGKIAPFTLLPNTPYRVRARYGSYDGGVPFEWCEWVQVKTPDVRLRAGVDMYPFNVADFNKDLTDKWAEQAENTRYISDEISRITTALNEMTADAELQRQDIRTVLTTQVNDNKAEYTSLITVQASNTSALSGRVDTLTATVEANKAEYKSLISTESDARQTQVTALQRLVSKNADDIASVDQFAQTNVTRLNGELMAVSQAVIQTQATVGSVSAGGFFQVKSEANKNGALATVGLTVSAIAGGAPSQAALFLEARSGGKSSIVMDADSVIMTSGPARSSPFAFQGGVLTLMATKVNEITAGVMRSFDNQVLFDLDRKLLIFRDST